MISHEIRTPLNGIMGASDLLKSQITTPEYFNLFKILEVSVKRLEKFTLDALQITSLKTKKYILELSSISAAKIINQILVGLSNEIEIKNLTIENEVSKELLIVVDINIFNDALKRIISNSIKHTPVNGIIKINMQKVDTLLDIQITDTGDGFKEEFLNKPITTFSTSSEFYNQNMGFDIAIVKLIVDYHSGNLGLSNLNPNGACVSIQIPQNIL